MPFIDRRVTVEFRVRYLALTGVHRRVPKSIKLASVDSSIMTRETKTQPYSFSFQFPYSRLGLLSRQLPLRPFDRLRAGFRSGQAFAQGRLSLRAGFQPLGHLSTRWKHSSYRVSALGGSTKVVQNF